MKLVVEKLDYVFAVLIALIVPLVDSLIFIGLLIVIDTITGMWAASKKKENVTSKQLANGVLPKIGLYPLILIASAGAESLFPEIPFIKGAAGIIAAVEVLSIFENANNILGFNLWDRAKEFLKKRKELDK